MLEDNYLISEFVFEVSSDSFKKLTVFANGRNAVLTIEPLDSDENFVTMYVKRYKGKISFDVGESEDKIAEVIYRLLHREQQEDLNTHLNHSLNFKCV